MASSALLIVDMISTFDFDGGAALRQDALRAAPAIARLRQRVREQGGHVIFVNDNFGRWRTSLDALVEAAGDDAREILRSLAPEESDRFVIKPKHSAFFQTPLPILLQSQDVERVIVTGVSAEACVLHSAFDARMHELDVWVPFDCVGALSAEGRSATQHILEQARIAIEPSE